MKSSFIAAVLVLAMVSSALAATTTAEITPNKFGSLRLAETTLEEAKGILGEPTRVKRLGQGCWDRMKRVWWGDDLRILFILSGGDHVVHTPRVTATQIDVAGGDRWRVMTGRGLQVGDSKARLLELYPNAKNYGSRTYTLLVRDGYKYQTATVDDNDRVKALTASHSC